MKTRRIRELQWHSQYYHTSIVGLKDTAVFFGDSEGISPHVLPGHCSDHSVVKYASHDQRQHELCPAVTLDIPSLPRRSRLSYWLMHCWIYIWRSHLSRICIWRSGLYRNCGLMQETQSHAASAESRVQETHFLLRNTSRGSLRDTIFRYNVDDSESLPSR